MGGEEEGVQKTRRIQAAVKHGAKQERGETQDPTCESDDEGGGRWRTTSGQKEKEKREGRKETVKKNKTGTGKSFPADKERARLAGGTCVNCRSLLA